MILDFFKRRREAKAQETALCAKYENAFEEFLQETHPLVPPKATKHKDAALYRHAWKRACVLEILAQRLNDEPRVGLYREFQRLAVERYYPVAPEGLYGKPQLRMEAKASGRLLKAEIERLNPSKKVQPKPKALACVYIGRCEKGLVYVGQTTLPPEYRWVQHRSEGTGPFKRGAKYVTWEVLIGPVPATELNEQESYFIGLHNAFENGHNDTRGNDWQAYEKGQKIRQGTVRSLG